MDATKDETIKELRDMLVDVLEGLACYVNDFESAPNGTCNCWCCERAREVVTLLAKTKNY